MRLCLKPVAGKLPLENRLRPNSERQLCPHTQLRHIGLTASFYSSPRRNDKTSCLSVTRWKRCPSYVCHLSLTFVKKMKLQLQMIHSFLKHVKYDSLHQRVLPVNRCYTSTCHSLCSDQLTYDIEICFKGWGFVFFPLFWLHHPALQCTKDLFCRSGGSRKWLPVWIAHVKVLPGFGNPKAQIKAYKSSVIPSQGKYFSHKRCRYRAAAAIHKCSCNWDDTAVKYENMHTYMYLYCPYTIKNRIPKPGISQMIYSWHFWMWTFWFFILQHARPCRETPLETPLEWANVHSNPFRKQGLDFVFSPSLLLKSFYFVEILKSPSRWRKMCFYCRLWKPDQYTFPTPAAPVTS